MNGIERKGNGLIPSTPVDSIELMTRHDEWEDRDYAKVNTETSV